MCTADPLAKSRFAGSDKYCTIFARARDSPLVSVGTTSSLVTVAGSIEGGCTDSVRNREHPRVCPRPAFVSYLFHNLLAFSVVLHRCFHYQAACKPELFWLDALGALQSVPFGAHGLASRFALSLIDNGFHEGMSLDEARDLMEACFRQLDRRYLVSSVGFSMMVVDKYGCRDVACKGHEEGEVMQGGEGGGGQRVRVRESPKPFRVAHGSVPTSGHRGYSGPSTS